jgi:hypothetical protein
MADLVEEVDTVLGDRAPVWDDVRKMPILRNVRPPALASLDMLRLSVCGLHALSLACSDSSVLLGAVRQVLVLCKSTCMRAGGPDGQLLAGALDGQEYSLAR